LSRGNGISNMAKIKVLLKFDNPNYLKGGLAQSGEGPNGLNHKIEMRWKFHGLNCDSRIIA